MREQSNLTIQKDLSKKKISSEDSDIPDFKTKIKLSDEQKKRLLKEINAEYEEIKKERDEMDLENKLEQLDRQYDGEMREIANMQFNVSRKTTAIKINAVERAINEAFFNGDHVFSISPRPEFEGKNGREVTEKQEDFLDYKIDEVIPLEETMSKVTHAACLKYGGILKLTQKYKVKKRKTNETYEGKWEPDLDEEGRVKIDKQTGQPVLINKGVEEFIQAYPSAKTDYPEYIKALMKEKTLDLVIEYDECVYDDPWPQAIDMKDFFVRKNVEGLDGLRDTYLTMERKQFTYWELIQEEKEEKLFDIEELITIEENGQKKKIDNYANETYELFECVFHFKEKDEDEDYARCVFHVSIEKDSVHGAEYYPYWGIDTYYIPFYVKDKEKGFYKKGLGEDLKDLHLAQNILLCLTLETAYQAALITPIVKEGSPIAAQFLEKTFTPGDPLIIRDKADVPDFLNKYFRPPDLGGLMGLGTYLGQEAGDISGVSDAFATGKGDPLDPSAPAQKTRDLLRQSGINIRDYVKVFGRSFNEVGNVLMQMYYQRNKKSYKFRSMRKQETDFREITRAEMAAKVNYQTQALTFDADKLNEKREDLALLQVLNNEPLFRQNEQAVYYAIRMLLTTWSQKWKNNRDRILMSPEDFNKQRIQIATQALQMYVQQLQVQAQQSGEQPQVDPRQLIGTIDQALREMATAPSKEELKQRQEGQ